MQRTNWMEKYKIQRINDIADRLYKKWDGRAVNLDEQMVAILVAEVFREHEIWEKKIWRK
tara:strand:- start:778 stop:957 length:180 start_codon:yes stop_codon:yes gene_type:complete